MNNIKITEYLNVVLLGLTIHNRFIFKAYINILCRRASFKPHHWLDKTTQCIYK